jgi:hypothetical protein
MGAAMSPPDECLEGDDGALLTKINVAVKAANEAETTVTTAQAELVSRSKAVGLLLLEAKKLHPKVKDFEAFLKRVDGLKPLRAYDLLRLAGGRTTDEELREEARTRKQKSRAAKRKTLPQPKLEPEPKQRTEPRKDSVTSTNVTESAEESGERRKAEYDDWLTSEDKIVQKSAANLREFEHACRIYLPKLTKGDLQRARDFFLNHFHAQNQKKEAA